MSQRQIQQQNQEQLVQTNPFGPSYAESAARHIWYRIAIVVLGIAMIMLGKSNLPSDSVPCIQDVILEFLTPITDFFLLNQIFGRIVLTFLHLIVDVELIGMLVYWYLYGQSFRYPLCLASLGAAKVMLNFLFRTVTIQKSFILGGYIPSLVFGQNFQNAYFFSGTCSLLILNFCQLVEIKNPILWKLQIPILIVVPFMLLCFKLNFFMDVITGLVFGHLIFRNIIANEKKINITMVGGFNWVLKKINPQTTESGQLNQS